MATIEIVQSGPELETIHNILSDEKALACYTMGSRSDIIKAECITGIMVKKSSRIDESQAVINIGRHNIPVNNLKNSTLYTATVKINRYGLLVIDDVPNDNRGDISKPIDSAWMLLKFQVFPANSKYINGRVVHSALTGDRESLSTPNYKPFPGYILAVDRVDVKDGYPTTNFTESTGFEALALMPIGEVFVVNYDRGSFYNGIYNTPFETGNGSKSLVINTAFSTEIVFPNGDVNPQYLDSYKLLSTLCDIYGEESLQGKIDTAVKFGKQDAILGDNGAHAIFTATSGNSICKSFDFDSRITSMEETYPLIPVSSE